MMTGKVILTHTDVGGTLTNVTSSATDVISTSLQPTGNYTATEVATAVTFGVAIMQVHMLNA